MTTPSVAKSPASPHTKWSLTVAIALGAAAVVVLVLLAFLWPSVSSTVHNLPIAVSGNGAMADNVRAQLDKSGAFNISTAENRDDAVNKIESRQEYGAVLVKDDGSGVEVLTASAASPIASQALNQVAAGAQAAIAQQVAAAHSAALQKAIASGDLKAVAAASAPGNSPKVTVTDVAPLSSHDPRGTGLALLGLPLAMGGMVGGVVISLVVSGFRRRLVASALYAVVGGLALIGVLQGWFAILSGPYFLNVLAMGLGLFAIAITIVGLESLIGRGGIPIGAVLTMFIGNPLSSLSSPQEFLPWHWGEIGQWFVPGATGTLLREISYFPNADASTHWLVLGIWAVAGTLLTVVGTHRNQEAVHIPAALDADQKPSTFDDASAAHAGKHAAV